ATLPPPTLPRSTPRRCVLMRPFVLAVACLAVATASALFVRTPAADVKQQATFGKDGVAFLKANCVRCHNDKKKNAGVSLHTLTDDASLSKQRKLIDRVVGVVKSGEMPPRESKQPLASDRETFLAVVKNVLDAHDRDAKPDPGRVT